MRSKLPLPTLLLLLLPALGAGATEKTLAVYDFRDRSTAPYRQNGAFAELTSEKTPDGERVLRVWCEHDTAELRYAPVLAFFAPAALAGDAAELEFRFWARAAYPGVIEARVTPRSSSSHLSTTGKGEFGPEWKLLAIRVKPNGRTTGDPRLNLPRLLFSTVKANDPIFIGPVSVIRISTSEEK